MNQQDLFAAIGAIDDMCLQRCDSYRPSRRWENIAKHAAVFVTVVLGMFFATYLLVPDVQAFFDRKAPHQKTYDYIQLPPLSYPVLVLCVEIHFICLRWKNINRLPTRTQTLTRFLQHGKNGPQNGKTMCQLPLSNHPIVELSLWNRRCKM